MSRSALGVAPILLLLFAGVAACVYGGWAHGFDRWILAALREPGRPGVADFPRWLVTGARAATHLGDGGIRAAGALAAAAALGCVGRVRSAAALVAGWAGEGAGVELIKAFAARARPDLPWRLATADAWSFPSGHAAGCMTLYPLLGLFLGSLRGGSGARIGLVLGVAVALLVGATRVLLGVHWASDVVAGWLAGGAVACLAARASPQPVRRG